MFDEIHALKQFKDVAHILAEKKDWPPLYDKKVLNNNKVYAAFAFQFLFPLPFVEQKLYLKTIKQSFNPNYHYVCFIIFFLASMDARLHVNTS